MLVIIPGCFSEQLSTIITHTAHNIMQAQRQNFTFPRYVFMAYDWFPPEWWTYGRSQIQVDCTDEDLTNFIERSLSFQWRPVPDDDNVTTDTGKVPL